jgi:serine/threonine protein kinase
MLKWAMQICGGMRYLHERNMLHRDIKSANVFLTKKGNVRIGDLGLARKAKGTAALTKCGTDCYMAPEMISGKAYGKKADVWSLGCVLFEMMSGTFMSELAGNPGAMVLTEEEFVETMLQQIPTRFSQSSIDLVRKMMHRGPNKRPSIDEVIHELERLCNAAGMEDPSFPRSRQSSYGNMQSISELSVLPKPKDLEKAMKDTSREKASTKSSRIRRKKRNPSQSSVE